MLTPSTSQHIYAADFVRPRPFAEFVQQNKDRLNALKRTWPYGDKFAEVLHVVREVQAHHQCLPLHDASDYDHLEGAMHSSLDLAVEALILLKGIPIHLDLPLVKREEHKERVFFAIILCALFSNIADSDVRYRIDGFDADNRKTTKSPCEPLARFFDNNFVKVRLWQKSLPDNNLYQSYASGILHRAGKLILDKIPHHEYSALYGFVSAFVENRMDDAKGFDPILFDCLLRAKKKISARNQLTNAGYLDERTVPNLKRQLALILSELFKNEWSIDKGGALRNSMVLFHAGKVYLRYPEAFSHIEESLGERWADSIITINQKKILSYMVKSHMVEEEANSLMVKLNFVEEVSVAGQKAKNVTVSAQAVCLANPALYIAEGTKTREYYEQDRINNNLSRIVKEKIQYGETDLSDLEEESFVAEYVISSPASSTKESERGKGFTKLFSAILPALNKDASKKAKINKNSEPKSPAELALIKSKQEKKSAIVKKTEEEIRTHLDDKNAFPYADKEISEVKPESNSFVKQTDKGECSLAEEAAQNHEVSSVGAPCVETVHTDPKSAVTNESKDAKASGDLPRFGSLGSRLKGLGRVFSSKLQGAVESFKKVKIFEISKEPSLSIPIGETTVDEEEFVYRTPNLSSGKEAKALEEKFSCSGASSVTNHRSDVNEECLAKDNLESQPSSLTPKEASSAPIASDAESNSFSIAKSSEKEELSLNKKTQEKDSDENSKDENSKDFDGNSSSSVNASIVSSNAELQGELKEPDDLNEQNSNKNPTAPENLNVTQKISNESTTLEVSEEKLTSTIPTNKNKPESALNTAERAGANLNKSKPTVNKSKETAAEKITSTNQNKGPSKNSASGVHTKQPASVRNEQTKHSESVLEKSTAKSEASAKTIPSDSKKVSKPEAKKASSGASSKNAVKNSAVDRSETKVAAQSSSNTQKPAAKPTKSVSPTTQAATVKHTAKETDDSSKELACKSKAQLQEKDKQAVASKTTSRNEAVLEGTKTAKTKPHSTETSSQTPATSKSTSAKTHPEKMTSSKAKASKAAASNLGAAKAVEEKNSASKPTPSKPSAEEKNRAKNNTKDDSAKANKKTTQLVSSGSKKGAKSASAANVSTVKTAQDHHSSSNTQSTAEQKNAVKVSTSPSNEKTRTDIRNEAVKQHNKEKAAIARKEKKRVETILATAGKPKAELTKVSSGTASSVKSQKQKSVENKKLNNPESRNLNASVSKTSSSEINAVQNLQTMPIGKVNTVPAIGKTNTVSATGKTNSQCEKSPASSKKSKAKAVAKKEKTDMVGTKSVMTDGGSNSSQTAVLSSPLPSSENAQTTYGKENKTESPLASEEKAASKLLAKQKTSVTAAAKNESASDIQKHINPNASDKHNESDKNTSSDGSLASELTQTAEKECQEEVSPSLRNHTSSSSAFSSKSLVSKDQFLPNAGEVRHPKEREDKEDREEKEYKEERISLNQGLSELFSMGVEEFFSEERDSEEVNTNINDEAKAFSSPSSTAFSEPPRKPSNTNKAFVPDPNNPLAAKNACFVYMVTEADKASENNNSSTGKSKNPSMDKSSGFSNKTKGEKLADAKDDVKASTVHKSGQDFKVGAGKTGLPLPGTSPAPSFGSSCILDKTHVFGSCSAAPILSKPAGKKVSSPRPSKQTPQGTKKTRAQKIQDAKKAQEFKKLRQEAIKEGRGELTPVHMTGNKTEPFQNLPSKLKDLNVGLYIAQYGFRR